MVNQDLVTVRTVPQVGLWQITESKQQWAQGILDELLALRTKHPWGLGYGEVFPLFYKNREWIADDSMLIRRAADIAAGKTATTILLISGDIRLAKRMARTIGLTVARVDPFDVIANNPDKVINASVVYTPHEALNTRVPGYTLILGAPPIYQEVLVDTGSLEAAAMKHGLTSNHRDRRFDVCKVEFQRSGLNENGNRFEVLRETIVKPHTMPPIRLSLANGQERMAIVISEIDNVPPPRMFERLRTLGRRFAKH
jgi:hypothetical protein